MLFVVYLATLLSASDATASDYRLIIEVLNTTSSGMLRHAGICCLHRQALIMEAVGTPKTSVNLYQTARRNIAEDSYIRRRENLKSHNE
jgi:hypothetical protein